MKERAVFLDKLRVAATCAVVLLHTVTGVMDHTDMGDYPVEKTVFLVLLDLICWCVPVFLMISGYLFLNPDRKITMGKMLCKYCRRIVSALFVFGVPYACLEQIATERCFRWHMIGNSFLMVLRGESWSHLWYLYLILFLYLLTPAMKKLLTVLPRPALYVLLAVLFAGSSVLPYLAKLFGMETVPALPDWGIYLFYYISGGMFVRKPGDAEFIKSADETGMAGDCGSTECGEADNERVKSGDTAGKARILPVLAAVLAAAMAGSRLSGDYTVQMAYNYPFTVVLSLLLFGWGNAVHGNASPGDKRADGFWNRAAGLSFTIYLVHPVFLNTAYKFFHVTPLSFSMGNFLPMGNFFPMGKIFPIGISLPVFWGLTLLLSTAVARVLYRIPLLRKYVL